MTDGIPTEPPAPPKETSLAEFLEVIPPDTNCRVVSLGKASQYGFMQSEGDIRLPCNSEECKGKGNLRFALKSNQQTLPRAQWKFLFVTYLCRNCQKTEKAYALALKLDEQGAAGVAHKFGEVPPFGPEVPARVITLIGPDRELFLSGRRAENRGLGIGAFAYYRRVVENQKGRIIQEMAKVAQKLGSSQDDLALFEAALKETQFTAAVDKVKSAIPASLRIDGHNPLTLLHDALSDGLHEGSDEE